MESIRSLTKKRNLNSELKSNIKCEKCGEKLFKNIGGFTVRVLCPCEAKEIKEREEEDKRKEKARKLQRLRKYSMMDEAFANNTFENFQIDENNEKIYKLAKNYCENWQQMKKENIGLLLYGDPGVGKTYITNCIANELMKNLTPVIVISTIGIINKIYDSYGKYGDDGEVAIINQLNNADLLIIDDLGAEHSHEKGKQIIYSIIDARSRANKPLIVTTNLDPNQLKEKLTGADGVGRTIDRLLASSYPIKISGTSKRRKNISKKEQIIKKLLLD